MSYQFVPTFDPAPHGPKRAPPGLGSAVVESIWAYDAVFAWNPVMKRWDREYANMFQTSKPFVFVCDGSYADDFPFWKRNAPPYQIWSRWAWNGKSWDVAETESNWPGGPHTCFG
jgi:hypothetical protein